MTMTLFLPVSVSTPVHSSSVVPMIIGLVGGILLVLLLVLLWYYRRSNGEIAHCEGIKKQYLNNGVLKEYICFSQIFAAPGELIASLHLKYLKLLHFCEKISTINTVLGGNCQKSAVE